ncbi:hypothetical protein DEU38_13415 [Rhodococcus sp. AG1013]|uniref:hypothetical protein n=1 Tax=Rhodococcus sp. AG1013 TaxID=2183996 RepID=UPI000E0C3F05|nr:hypothetical protein [Rhodococcus sp. AG1013]RDI13440.1 hypothetical protein DEU38_13415 [Rhodococcus sp. AG1013]
MNPNLITDILRAKLADQPIIKRYANTATAAVGLVVALLWAVVSAGVDVPANITTGVLVLVSFGTVVGIKFTPNGVTERQVDELERYVKNREG